MATLALFVCICGSASARELLGEDDRPTAGPVLSGNGVVYLAEVAGYRIVRITPGDAHALLHSGTVSTHSSNDDESGGFSYGSVGFDASASRLAFHEAYGSGSAKYQQGTSEAKLFTGPLAGSFALRDSCSGGYPGVPGFRAAVDGDVVAYARDDCNVLTNAAGKVVVRNDAAGTRRVFSVGEPVGQVRLAGRYVAFERPRAAGGREVAVYDWAAGAFAYAAPIATSGPSPGSSFDLQADGKLALLRWADAGDGCGGRSVDWYSVASPTAHPFPVAACGQGIRLAADRIAVATAGSGDGRVLMVSGLNGGARPVADLGPRGSLGAGDFDLDSSRVAYSQGSCLGARFYIAPVERPGAIDPDRSACPVRFVVRRVRLRARAALLRMRCPDGCKAELALVLPRGRYRGGRLRVRRARTLGETEIELDRGRPARVAFRFGRRARSRLRRYRPRRLILTADVRQPDGTTDERRYRLRVRR